MRVYRNMFDSQVVDFRPGDGRLDLSGLPVLIDSDDFEGIRIAADNLVTDLERVTEQKSTLLTNLDDDSIDGLIIVGSLEKSRYIRKLVAEGSLTVGKIEGKWESSVTILLPSSSLAKNCLVIAGSDKRGTIYGIYTLCEQIGVSPWHWWADVSVKKHDHVYALPTTTYLGEPSVRYRGLFINDEVPALSSWVHGKFGPKLNSEFYKTVFELLLRLKANFIWPGMWSGSSFFTDDPLNQQLADTYGIVVSTSHHEPMQRSMSEWLVRGDGDWRWGNNKERIIKYFDEGAERAQPFESFITMGMRGPGDSELDSDDPVATLTEVLDTQRNIISKYYGKKDGERQLMALYKEVQRYYENGLEIPDDVTLLFSDDNFGHIRRLPTEKESKRSGGAGIYFHFEYVGHPRGYKWINTNSCGNVYQQLQDAYNRDARMIWVINVGDIKPMELPFTFAMSVAWDISKITSTNIPDFFQQYSLREFGPEHASEIAELLLKHDRLLAIRKHEHIELQTFSILNYHEAESIVDAHKELEDRAAALFETVPETQKASFFQLVLHPIKATRIYIELRVLQSLNNLYGRQRRNSTNAVARRILELFDDDFDLSEQYHNNPWVGDKWNHIMRQPHYGYINETWHDPSRDMISGLSYVQNRQNSNPMFGQMGIAVEGHPGVRPGIINEDSYRMHPSQGDLVAGLTVPELSPYGPQSRWFEIFTRGTHVVEWTAVFNEKWATLSKSSGKLDPNSGTDQRVEISVNWADVPKDFNQTILVHIRTKGGEYEQVHVPVINRQTPPDFHGFVESDRSVSIEVGAVQLTPDQKAVYEHQPYLGRLSAGAISLRSDINLTSPTSQNPFLEYPLFLFTDRATATVILYITMVLDTNPESDLMYDISFDDHLQQSVHLLEKPGSPGDLPPGWTESVENRVWIRNHSFPDIPAGAHVLKFRPLSKTVALEKVVVNTGPARFSYLGPPASSVV
ncbi:hypothetical protein F5884DRAFT_242342 [Xylogone sp. PMI_703]|nr:hypothetical protein F5884DRAFT_242342 [Xylogone sp. PMI_703]